jgi:hypothetical protein
MSVSSDRGLRAVCVLAIAAGCTDAGESPTGPASLDHAPSPSVTSTTVHSSTVTGLNAAIATDDLIAGLDAEQLPGDLGWASSIEADTLRVPTDGLGSQSTRYGLLVDNPGSGNPTKRLRYALAGPSDIQEIRVLTGHPFEGSGDARAFSTFVARYSTDGGVSYHLLGYFQSDPSGTINAGVSQATLVTISDSQSPILLASVTHLEFDFFAVGSGTEMRDPYDGPNSYTGVNDNLAAATASPFLWEIDVIGEPAIPANQAPTADAGVDQNVVSGTVVSLDGTQSSDPDADQLSYAWTQTSGPTVTLTNADQATASFTAPDGPASLVFELTVCDTEPLCDTDAVTITVAAPSTDVLDVAAEVIVNGPVKSNGTSKDFVAIVTNTGTLPVTVSAQDLAGTVSVDGLVIGTVSSADASKTLEPGRSNRFKMVWNWPSGAFARGDELEFQVCVGVAGDADPTNNCSIVTVVAK